MTKYECMAVLACAFIMWWGLMYHALRRRDSGAFTYGLLIMMFLVLFFVFAPTAKAETCEQWQTWATRIAQARDKGVTEQQAVHPYVTWYHQHEGRVSPADLQLVLTNIHAIYYSGFLAGKPPETVGGVMKEMCEVGWN